MVAPLLYLPKDWLRHPIFSFTENLVAQKMWVHGYTETLPECMLCAGPSRG